MLRKLIVLGTNASGTSLTISAPQQQTLSTPAHASGSMPAVYFLVCIAGGAMASNGPPLAA